ncbi:hypothetical protein L1049_020247 [Liquidambar formosana]|uniref:DUF7610 domain-containing protein n=1 Tax=Liquidambar formosana TaxID=63359 RepID=A0AAP0X9Q4_LIQFO
MTKRYAILQKKLQELESELNQVFTFPAENPCHQLLSEGIDQRFVFLNNLLSAEIASHPKKPHHLEHIAHRLVELETAFHDWDDFRTSAIDHIDTISTCSCTESCLNDDDGEGSDGLDSRVCEEDDVQVFYDGVIEEKPPEEEVVVAKVEPERVVRREEVVRVWIRKYGGVMASGVLLGMVLMGLLMVRFSGCFHYIEHGFSVTPT